DYHAVLVQGVCHGDCEEALSSYLWRGAAHQAPGLVGRGCWTDSGVPGHSAPVTTISRQMAPGRPGVGMPGPSVWIALLMRGVRAATPDARPVRQRECR